MIYLPAKGRAESAATTKMAQVFEEKGGWTLLEELQKQHGYKRGTQDPSLHVIMEHLLQKVIGRSVHQRDSKISGAQSP